MHGAHTTAKQASLPGRCVQGAHTPQRCLADVCTGRTRRERACRTPGAGTASGLTHHFPLGGSARAVRRASGKHERPEERDEGEPQPAGQQRHVERLRGSANGDHRSSGRLHDLEAVRHADRPRPGAALRQRGLHEPVAVALCLGAADQLLPAGTGQDNLDQPIVDRRDAVLEQREAEAEWFPGDRIIDAGRLVGHDDRHPAGGSQTGRQARQGQARR